MNSLVSTKDSVDSQTERVRTGELRKYAAMLTNAAAGTAKTVGTFVREHPVGTAATILGAGAQLPETSRQVSSTFKDRLQRSMVARAGYQP